MQHSKFGLPFRATGSTRNFLGISNNTTNTAHFSLLNILKFVSIIAMHVINVFKFYFMISTSFAECLFVQLLFFLL